MKLADPNCPRADPLEFACCKIVVKCTEKHGKLLLLFAQRVKAWVQSRSHF